MSAPTINPSKETPIMDVRDLPLYVRDVVEKMPMPVEVVDATADGVTLYIHHDHLTPLGEVVEESECDDADDVIDAAISDAAAALEAARP